MPLRQKLFLILGLMTSVPLLILLFGVVERVEGDLQTRLEGELHDRLGKMAAEVDTILKNQVSVAKGVAQVPVIRTFLASARQPADAAYDERVRAVQSFFLDYQRVVPNIQALRLLDDSGKTVVKVKEGKLIEPQFVDPNWDRYYVADQSARPFVREALLGVTDVYVSDFELGQVRADAEFCPAMMRYSVPVRDDEGGVQGLIVINMWGSHIDQTVRASMGEHSGKAYIVELNDEPARDGIYLYHENNDYRFANQLGTDYRFKKTVGDQYWRQIKAGADFGSLLLDDGRMYFYAKYMPYLDQRSEWLLMIETSRDEVFAPIAHMRFTIWFLLFVLLVLSLLVARWVANRLARPVHAFARIITDYADGDTLVRYTDTRNDEVGIAGRAFNYMCDSLENARNERDKAERAVQQSERLAAVGQMAAGIGHEINNPLMNIMSLASLIDQSLKEHDDQQVRHDLKTLQQEGRRCARIVQGILNFARANEPTYQQFDMAELIQDTVGLLKHRLTNANLRLIEKVQAPLVMQGDANQLQQVLVNVLLNALHVSPSGGSMGINAQQRDGQVIIEVSDHGPGVSDADMPRVFNPFYTTKPEGKGTGLGLSVSYGIVQRHHGTIVLENGSEKGATVRITLPVEVNAQDAETVSADAVSEEARLAS